MDIKTCSPYHPASLGGLPTPSSALLSSDPSSSDPSSIPSSNQSFSGPSSSGLFSSGPYSSNPVYSDPSSSSSNLPSTGSSDSGSSSFPCPPLDPSIRLPSTYTGGFIVSAKNGRGPLSLLPILMY